MRYIKLLLLVITALSFSSIWSETIWFEDFESASQWILTGEFEIDSPHGYGGEHGNPDPTGAFEGSNCLGSDLTGLGSNAGDYEGNLGDRAYKAISPAINCSQYLNITISFQKWLNVEQPAYDHAYFEISIDGGASWIELWSNGETIEDNSWSEMVFDVSEYADQQSSVKLRYSIGSSDASWFYSGWNVDNITVSGVPAVFGTLNGNIYDINDNQPLEDAMVVIGSNQVNTDTNGFYSVELPVGNHNIAFRYLNYFEMVSADVEIIQETVTTLDAYLTPCSPASNLAAQIINDYHVQLQWDVPENQLQPVLGYNVYRNDILMESVLDNNFLDENVYNGIYNYYITAIYMYGNSLPTNSVEVEITDYSTIDPNQLHLDDKALLCYPNPVRFSQNSGTYIAFNLKESTSLSIDIYNVKGQLVKTLFNGIESAGNHALYWDGKDSNGKFVSQGIYFSRLDNSTNTVLRKIVVLR